MVIVQITNDNREAFREYHKPVPWFGTAPEALLQGFSLLPEVTVHVIGCTQRPMASSPEKLADNIWFHSLLVPKLGWMRTGFQGCIRAVRRKVRELKPDIVHGQGTERECSISAVFTGYPNVLTVHGNMRLVAKVTPARPFSYYWLAARLESLTLPRADGVVCITRYTEEAVRDLAKRTWLLPNAVDSTFFEISREPDTVPLILCIGQVCLRKNQNAFIRALDSLADRMKFKLCFLGMAQRGLPYEDEFFNLLETRPWCSYEGFASREKLKSLMRRAAAVALPSVEDNCPMAVLEGMAAGVAVVAPRIGGVPDLVEDGRNGFLCDPHDALSMRTAMERVLSNPAEVSAIATLAQREAKQRFHPLVIARKHVEIYREVLGAVK